MARVLGPTLEEGSLAASPAFVEARRRTAADGAHLFAYLDLSVLETEGDEAARRISGIDGLTTIAASLRMTDGRARETVWLGFPGGRRGLFAVFPGARADLSTARLAPENAFAFGVAAIRPSDLLRVLTDLAEAGEGGPLGFLRDVESGLKERLGARAIADLVDCLGPEVLAYASFPRSGGPVPELLAAIEVLEPEKLLTGLDALVRTVSGAEPRSLTYRERRIRYLPSSDDLGFMAVSPCWCVTDGYLLLSYHPTILKSAILRMDGKRENLTDDPAFVAARRALPEEAAGAGYLSTERLFRFAYGLALPFLTAQAGELPFDPAALPTADAIAQHLSFALSAVTLEEKGMAIRTDSDGYGPTSLTLYGLIVASLFVSPSDVRDDGLRGDGGCGYNLERIHGWIEESRERHGRWPAKLVDVDSGDRWQRYYARCPAAERAREAARGGEEDAERAWHGEDFGYRIEALGLAPDADLAEDAMLLWDSEPRHGGGRIVLLVDGSLTWMREAEFERRLEEAKR